LEEGNIRAAVRLLLSDEPLATPSEISVSKLRAKHPPSSLSPEEICPTTAALPLIVSADEVLKAVSSFPTGSSGGLDGLSPQHLKSLVNCRQGGSALLNQVTIFVNMLLAGSCPPEVAKIFFGGRLLAFDKPGGDVRPIVIGFTLRRLASKLANAYGIKKTASYLRPRQLGAGTIGGLEAAIHAARRFLDQAGEDQIMVKIDFRNAFNTLHRKHMLEAVDSLVPEISNYVRSGYSSP